MELENEDKVHRVIEAARQSDLNILIFNVKTVSVSKEPVKKYRLAFNIMDLLDDYRAFLRHKDRLIAERSRCRKKIIEYILSAFDDETEKKKHLKLVTINN